MQVGEFRYHEGLIIGPKVFMSLKGKSRISEFEAGSLEVQRVANDCGCSEVLACLILLHIEYSDWWACQRHAYGVQQGQDLAWEGIWLPRNNRTDLAEIADMA